MQPWKRAYEAGEVEVCTDGEDEAGKVKVCTAGEDEAETKSSWLEEAPPIKASDMMMQLFTESAL